MKRILALLMVIVSLAAFAGCGAGGGTEAPLIRPEKDIKGIWVVASTPETVTLTSPSEYQDTAKMYDMNIRASINAVFPPNGDIEIFENGVASCNGLSMAYRYVAEDAIEFSVKGTGLIFKVSMNEGNLVLKLNDKYEVVMQKK